MTDQKTSGKSTKYCTDQFLGTCEYLKEKDEEIQQLKKTNELLVKNLNFEIRNRMKLEKQIETTKKEKTET